MQDDTAPVGKPEQPVSATQPTVRAPSVHAGEREAYGSRPRHLPEPHTRSSRRRQQDDRELSQLITAWIRHEWSGDKVKSAYIENEFEGRLQSYRRWARGWRIAQISIWVVITLLGLLISVFAGFKVGHGFTIVAGALVATLTTLANATHPAQQADGYLNARLGLRDEGWTLLNQTDGYAQLGDPEARFAHFTDAIHSIVATKRANTTLDALAPQ
jgi:hypothetical protein